MDLRKKDAFKRIDIFYNLLTGFNFEDYESLEEACEKAEYTILGDYAKDFIYSLGAYEAAVFTANNGGYRLNVYTISDFIYQKLIDLAAWHLSDNLNIDFEKHLTDKEKQDIKDYQLNSCEYGDLANEFERFFEKSVFSEMELAVYGI